MFFATYMFSSKIISIGLIFPKKTYALDEFIRAKTVVAYGDCSASHRQNHQKSPFDKMVYNTILLGQAANHQESHFKVKTCVGEKTSFLKGFDS